MVPSITKFAPTHNRTIVKTDDKKPVDVPEKTLFNPDLYPVKSNLTNRFSVLEWVKYSIPNSFMVLEWVTLSTNCVSNSADSSITLRSIFLLNRFTKIGRASCRNECKSRHQ